MAKLRLLTRLPRAVRGAAIAIAVALVVAAPAVAAGPTRTVFDTGGVVTHWAAGNGCTFDVTVYRAPGSRFTEMDFADGRYVSFGHTVDRTITNDATGTSIDVHIEAHELDRFGDDGLIRGSVNGQSAYGFLPGDVAPDGSIVDHAYAIFIKGTVSYVIDGTTFATLAISIQGSYFDICAAIS